MNYVKTWWNQLLMICHGTIVPKKKKKKSSEDLSGMCKKHVDEEEDVDIKIIATNQTRQACNPHYKHNNSVYNNIYTMIF